MCSPVLPHPGLLATSPHFPVAPVWVAAPALYNQSVLGLGEEHSWILGLYLCPVSEQEKCKAGWSSREFPEFSPCCQQFVLLNQRFPISVMVVDGFFLHNVPAIHAKFRHPGARNSLGVEQPEGRENFAETWKNQSSCEKERAV